MAGVTIYIISIDIVAFAQAWVDIYRDNTITTNGTAITPINLNLGSTNTSPALVEYGGSYTIGQPVHSTVVPGGSLIRAVGGASEVGESVIIPETKNILVRVTNKSASASDISIRIIWWEE